MGTHITIILSVVGGILLATIVFLLFRKTGSTTRVIGATTEAGADELTCVLKLLAMLRDERSADKAIVVRLSTGAPFIITPRLGAISQIDVMTIASVAEHGVEAVWFDPLNRDHLTLCATELCTRLEQAREEALAMENARGTPAEMVAHLQQVIGSDRRGFAFLVHVLGDEWLNSIITNMSRLHMSAAEITAATSPPRSATYVTMEAAEAVLKRPATVVMAAVQTPRPPDRR
jgi:hypothetical protein